MSTFDSTHFYSVPLGCASPETTKPTQARGTTKGCREKEAICPQTVPVINIHHHHPKQELATLGCVSLGLTSVTFQKWTIPHKITFWSQLMELSREILETLEDRASLEEADQQKCDFKGYRWPPILPPPLSIQYAMRNIPGHTVSAAMSFCQSTWGQVTRTEPFQNREPKQTFLALSRLITWWQKPITAPTAEMKNAMTTCAQHPFSFLTHSNILSWNGASHKN